MTDRQPSVGRKIYRIVSWALVVLTVISLVLLFIKPTAPKTQASPEEARAFDQKFAQLAAAGESGKPAEIHITEAELNSKIAESFQAGSMSGPAKLTAVNLHLLSDQMVATMTMEILGVDIDVTVGGTLAVRDHTLEFNPTQFAMGSMPVPASIVAPVLRSRLDSPQMRDMMRLPSYIDSARIENGELNLTSKGP